MKDMLIQVITSWQVIFITVVVILYLFLVSYVAKLYHKARMPKSSGKKSRKKASSGIEGAAEEPALKAEGNEEIILEE
ncbi:MAG: hypothetical protein LBT16_05765 [Treponema sp.]|jgi:hypothetical protein|nr:hypothetical protein [Treponema sp.]